MKCVWYPTAVALACAAALGSPAEPPAKQETPAHALPEAVLQRTKPIFDGKSLDGWIQVPANSWTVKDGAMASTGAGRGILYTRDDYTKYRLVFTMRHVSGSPDHQACVL